MNLIPCNEDCLYQRDGYCNLETPAIITNNTGTGCIHQIKLDLKKKAPENIKSPQPPQTHL